MKIASLDRRDFQGFADLWAQDAEYVQGRGPGVKGPAAIRALLEKAFSTNAAGVRDPNFHVFYNAAIIHLPMLRDMQMLGVRYLIVPKDHHPPFRTLAIAGSGPYVLRLVRHAHRLWPIFARE